MPKQRVTELDFMRSVAIFMVVVLHATARFMVYGPSKSRTFMLSLALNQWSRVSLPLFVFLSGFGLFYNNKEFELKTYAKKRLARVFLPYCTWTLLYMVRRDFTDPAFCFLKLPALKAFLKYIQWLFWKNIDTPLWFILMIMQMYILFPLMFNCIKNAKPVKAFIINTAIYLLLTIYLRYYKTQIGFAPIDFIQKYCPVRE